MTTASPSLESVLVPVDLDVQVAGSAHAAAADGAGHDVVQCCLAEPPRIRAGSRGERHHGDQDKYDDTLGALAVCRTSSVNMQDDLAGHGSFEQGADRRVGLTPARLALDGAVKLALRDQQ